MNFPPEQSARAIVDGATVAAGVSSPLWYQYLEYAGTKFLLWGAVALMVIRLAIAWRDWRNGKRGQ